MALSLSGTGGMNMMFGIQMRMSAQGAITGATLVNQKMDKLKTTTRRTARNFNGLNKEMDNFKALATQASASLATIGFAMFQAGKSITERFTKNVVSGAGDYEVAMGRVQFATNATANEMEKLNKVMIRTGLETIETPTSAAEAFKTLRTSGLQTVEALELLPKSIQMVTGAGGLLSMEAATRAAVSAIKKFRHQGVPFAKTMDDIAQSTRETALQWEDMPAFFNALRDAPMRLRATSAEILALGGLMKSAGMQSAEAGQSISIFANKMIVNQRKLKAYLLKMGVSMDDFFKMDPKDLPRRIIMFQKFNRSIFDAAGNLRPMKDILVDVVERMQELMKVSDEEGLTVLSAVFGEKAGAMVSMLRQLTENGVDAREAFTKFFNAVDDSAGSLEKAEKAFLKTSKGIEKLIEGTKDTIFIVLGTTILPIFSDILSSFKDVLNTFLSFIQENPAFAKALTVTTIALGLLSAAIGAVLVGLAGLLFYQSVAGPALAAVGGIAGALVLGFNALLSAMGPILIVGGAIVALFFALFGVFKLWNYIWKAEGDSVAAAIRNTFTNIKLILQGLVEWWDGEGSEKLFRQLKSRNLEGVVGFFLQIKKRITSVFEGIVAGFKPVLSMFIFVVKGIWWFFGQFFKAFNGILELFGTKDIENEIESYRRLGIVIGFVASIIAGALTVALVGATLRFTAMGAAMFLARIRTFLLIAAVLLFINVYGQMIDDSIKLGEKLGNSLYELQTDFEKWMEKVGLTFREVGEKASAWFGDAFKDGFYGFVDWLLNQLSFIKTKMLSVFGLASAKELETARKKALGSAANITLTTDAIIEKRVAERRGFTGGTTSEELIQKELAYARAKNEGKLAVMPRREATPEISVPPGQRAAMVRRERPSIGKIEVNVNGDVREPNAFAQKVAEAMSKKMMEEDEIAYGGE